jgi:hypothetical protein
MYDFIENQSTPVIDGVRNRRLFFQHEFGPCGEIGSLGGNLDTCWGGGHSTLQKNSVDQIGRNWVIVFWAVFENYKRRQNFWPAYFHGTSYVCIKFDKKWVGLHFGQYFQKLIWSPSPSASYVKNWPQGIRISYYCLTSDCGLTS